MEKKNKIAIITDSASDVSQKNAQKYGIKVIPLRICFSDKEYRDGVDIRDEELYPIMKKEIPKTSLPYREDVLRLFDEMHNEGYSEAIYIGISSGLSGTYNFVKMIAEEYEKITIHCFDTKSLSCGQNMLVMLAINLCRSIENAKNIIDKLGEIRKKTECMFVVRDLTYLIKGGRIGKVAGTVGSFLNLSPVIFVNEAGVYETAAKSIGFNRAVETMLTEIKKRFAGTKAVVSMTYACEREIAERLLLEIKKFVTVVESNINPVTAVLGVHTGPGMAGVSIYEA